MVVLRRIAIVSLVLSAALVACADEPKPALERANVAWPKPGAMIKTPLSRLYNVTGSEFRDRFHCFLTEYSMDPTIMVVVKGTDTLENAATLKMLRDLDKALADHRLQRLHAFVVVLDPALQDVVKQDVPRYQLKKKVESVVNDEKNKLKDGRLPFGITSPNYLTGYPLPEDAALMMVFSNHHQVVTSSTFSKEKLAEADVAKGLAEGLAKLLPAK